MAQIPYSRSRLRPRPGPGPHAEGAHLAGTARQIKQSCASGLAACAALAAAAGPAEARDTPGNADFRVGYGAYYLGLKLMETEFEVSFDDAGYDARSMYRTGGVIAWVKKDEIRSSVHGEVDGDTLAPRFFEHYDVLQRGRTVQMAFAPDDIAVTATPPYSTLGDPPATQEHRRGAFDLISGIMQISMNIGDDPAYPCGRDVPIFNGKERYDLRMAHAGAVEAETDAYRGPAIACYVYYMPVAGFDADDMPKEKHLNTPLTVWFTDSAETGFHIPIRFSYPVGIGTLVIEAKDLDVRIAGAGDHAERQDRR